MNIKQNKGIGLADALIAVAILMIFTGIIVSVSYNIYLQSNFIKRNNQSTGYIVEIFEYAQGLLYDDVTSDNLVKYINDKYDNVNAISERYTEEIEEISGYKIFINVEDKYSNEEDKEGYIKQIDITVMYKLGKKIKTVDMSTLINK